MGCSFRQTSSSTCALCWSLRPTPLPTQAQPLRRPQQCQELQTQGEQIASQVVDQVQQGLDQAKQGFDAVHPGKTGKPPGACTSFSTACRRACRSESEYPPWTVSGRFPATRTTVVVDPSRSLKTLWRNVFVERYPNSARQYSPTVGSGTPR
jgi:hypothetical protein